mmetsp:Transcript_21318/g.64142  ORF Transcript_21318/g.64142 Transcript_21318/m.64142 type:complete len:390 (+) Transcript_21318:300-1469(+)|eukprot:CAMPEP_0206146570 /NCGR_PEP_ID=MMETSP1473-20131121/30768_1 /ASSEMBLY_ACC=CAM_ASM_001109 /TAXON_ID=1461547 /ORGANISM="Stichococcus sp, Strain RCC1054" /LENGTH=389 /DNA_ID=CAMNT_0053543175 /DNA_START=248 /DNA_END=1417 /DNA_ORIENTATION=+
MSSMSKVGQAGANPAERTTQRVLTRKHDHHRELKFPENWQPTHTVRPKGFNATNAHFHDPHTGAVISWNARAHRKNRFALARHPDGRPVRQAPAWWRYRWWGWDFDNISWWTAQLFVWGSCCWVVNGWFLFLPTGRDNLNLYMAAYFALGGGTLFWIGAYLSVVEALNTDVQVRFPHEVMLLARDAEKGALHGYKNSKSLPANGLDTGLADTNGTKMESSGPAINSPQKKKFRWWGTKWHDIGYFAVFVQLIGATLFQASVILGVPGVLPEETKTAYAAWDASFWTLQTVGAWGFIISSVIFMLEVQHKWWQPAPLKLGWQVGLWNHIGAWGFEASAVFGYLAFPRMIAQRWGSAFSTFWGGWAFLIGSYMQLLECLNKHPTTSGEKMP